MKTNGTATKLKNKDILFPLHFPDPTALLTPSGVTTVFVFLNSFLFPFLFS